MSRYEARNAATNVERLEELSDTSTAQIMVARNPVTPARLLERLAQDQNAQVRAAVASNPNTPWLTLEELAWEFPQAFLHNPLGPLQMVAHPEQISRDEAFWGAVLREAAIPPWWWSWLRSYPTADLSHLLRLHIQEAGEATSPNRVIQQGEEIDLLMLVQLLTVTAIQGTALPLQAPNAWEQFPRGSLLWLAREAPTDVRRTMARNQ